MPSIKRSGSPELAQVVYALPLKASYGYNREEMEGEAVLGSDSGDRVTDLEI